MADRQNKLRSRHHLTATPFRTPEQEQAEKGRGVAAAGDLALEDINPLNAYLFRENRWQDHLPVKITRK